MGNNFKLKCIKTDYRRANEGDILEFRNGKTIWRDGTESWGYENVDHFFTENIFYENYFEEYKEEGLKLGDGNIKPNYYNNSQITPFDYIKANKLDFFEGNIIKYITRYKSKNGMEDLLKAKTYLEEIIKGYEEKNEL